MSDKPYSVVVHEWLLRIPIAETLKRRAAIVLERVAEGGGATNWYVCRNYEDLAQIVNRLSPGSVVSFYFDQRIRSAPYSSETRKVIEKIVSETGDCVVGTLSDDTVSLDVDFVAGPNDLNSYETSLKGSATVYFGAFPPRDNDGEVAMTLELPDRDGVVRPHTH